jgi:glucose 1-dehydrogenase
MTLQGKVALVTGASRGIGKASAIELARAGADVAVNYRSHPAEAEETAAAIRALGRRVIVIQGDVSDRKSDQQMVDTTVERLGSLDVLVANAAYSIRKPFIELSEEDMASALAVTLWGVFHCCQFAARQMVSQGHGGNIIVISSPHAWFPLKNCVPYNTAKAGVNQMALTIANELARYRIRVNIVEPGWTDTPGERQHSTEEELQAGGRRIPLGRLATAQEIAHGVVFMASENASYVTASTLRIDGGFVLPRPEL